MARLKSKKESVLIGDPMTKKDFFKCFTTQSKIKDKHILKPNTDKHVLKPDIGKHVYKPTKKAPVFIQKIPSHCVPLSTLNFPKNYSMNEQGITQSMIKKFFSCRQLWFFAINGLKPIGTKYTYDFGNIMHDLFEQVAKRQEIFIAANKNGILSQLIEDCIDSYLQKLVSEGKEYKNEAVTKVGITLKKFFEYSDILLKRNFHYVEKEFCTDFELTRSNVVKLLGKVDSCIIESDGSYSQCEYKSKQKFSDLFFKLLKYDFQSQFYSVLDREVEATKYLIIRNSTMKSVDPEKLIKKISDDIDTEPEKYFKEHSVKYYPEDRKRFHNELSGKLRTIYSVLYTQNKINIFPEQSACSGFGHCPYIDICESNQIDMTKYRFRDKIFSELNEVV